MQSDIGLRSVTDGEFQAGLLAHGLHIRDRRGAEGRANLRTCSTDESGDIGSPPSACGSRGQARDDTPSRLRVRVPPRHRRHDVPGGDPKPDLPAPDWSTTAAGPRLSTPGRAPTSERVSGRTSAPPTRRGPGGGFLPPSSAPTSISTTHLGTSTTLITRRSPRRGEDSAPAEISIRSINRALRDRPAGMGRARHTVPRHFRSSWVAGAMTSPWPTPCSTS